MMTQIMDLKRECDEEFIVDINLTKTQFYSKSTCFHTEVKATASKWRGYADKLNISKGNQDLMSRAFRVIEK